jgi:hypothetical protein
VGVFGGCCGFCLVFLLAVCVFIVAGPGFVFLVLVQVVVALYLYLYSCGFYGTSCT